MRRKIYLSNAILLAMSLAACGGGSSESAGSTELQTEADSSKTADNEQASSDSEDAPAASDSADADDDDSDETEEDNSAYVEKAKEIYSKADQLFSALKEGDIQTVVDLGDPDDYVTSTLSYITDSETAKEIFKTVYADLCWEYTDEDIERTAEYLQEAAEAEVYGEEFDLSMTEIAYKWMLAFRYTSLAYFEDGDVIPENYKPETKEEAFDILKKGLEETPLQYMSSVTATTPDENGNFYFIYDEDYLFDDAGIVNLYDGDDTMAQTYVKNLMDVISDYTIGDTDAKYEKSDELINEATELALNKDFEKLYDLLKDPSELTYKENLGSYDELTDSQKAFVDECVEKAQVVFEDYTSTHGDGTRVRNGIMEVSFPYYDRFDDEQTEFAKDNNVYYAGSYVYFGSFSEKTFGGSLLYGYFRAIEYAKNMIE